MKDHDSTCWLPKGFQKQYLLRVTTMSFGATNFINNKMRGSTFFQSVTNLIDSKNEIKKQQNVFKFWDIFIRIGTVNSPYYDENTRHRQSKY